MENDLEEILKHFDTIFNTNTKKDITDLPLFHIFYEYFADDFYTPTDETKELMKELRLISDKLEKTFTKKQQQLFEDYWDLDSQISENLRKQLFLFGYITATELFIETAISQAITESTSLIIDKRKNSK